MRRHGTISGYTYGCRCEACRGARRDYGRRLRSRAAAGDGKRYSRRKKTTAERARISRAVRAKLSDAGPDYLARATAQVEAISGVPAGEWSGEEGRARHRAVTRLLLEWAVERGELDPVVLDPTYRPMRPSRKDTASREEAA